MDIQLTQTLGDSKMSDKTMTKEQKEFTLYYLSKAKNALWEAAGFTTNEIAIKLDRIRKELDSIKAEIVMVEQEEAVK